MRKLILLILPVLYLGACTETEHVHVAPPPPTKTVHVHSKKKSDDNFHAVEKPSTYSR